MRRRLQIKVMTRRSKVFRFNRNRRARPPEFEHDSAVGSSPRSRQRTMSMIPAAAAGAAFGPYGGAAVRAASTFQRVWRNRRAYNNLFAYARGLRRMYNRYGARAANAMSIGTARPKKPSIYPRQKSNHYRLTKMQGKGAGKFKKPVKLSKKVSPYLTKGFESTTEIHGAVTDPNCVYIGASCVSTSKAIEIMAQALLRKLFEKCFKIPITNIRTPLQAFWNNTFPFNRADGFRIQLTWMQVNNVTGEGEISYETNGTDSIYSICGEIATGTAATFPAMMAKFREWAHRTAPSDANTQIPLRLNVYMKDSNVTPFWFGQGGIDLRALRIHYESAVSIKLQNRSVSATGSTSTDVVDANPLQGYLYEFKGGVPMFRNLDQASGTLRLNRMFDNSAVMLCKAGDFGTDASPGPGNVNREPPKPRFFANCVKASKVRLDPGDVKSHFFTWKTSMRFLDYLRKINVQNDAGLIIQTVNTPGKCVLFALEDMLNVNASNLIAVAYESNRVDKCYVTENPIKVAQGTFTQLTVNELTPG